MLVQGPAATSVTLDGNTISDVLVGARADTAGTGNVTVTGNTFNVDTGGAGLSALDLFQPVTVADVTGNSFLDTAV